MPAMIGSTSASPQLGATPSTSQTLKQAITALKSQTMQISQLPSELSSLNIDERFAFVLDRLDALQRQNTAIIQALAQNGITADVIMDHPARKDVVIPTKVEDGRRVEEALSTEDPSTPFSTTMEDTSAGDSMRAWTEVVKQYFKGVLSSLKPKERDLLEVLTEQFVKDELKLPVTKRPHGKTKKLLTYIPEQGHSLYASKFVYWVNSGVVKGVTLGVALPPESHREAWTKIRQSKKPTQADNDTGSDSDDTPLSILIPPTQKKRAVSAEGDSEPSAKRVNVGADVTLGVPSGVSSQNALRAVPSGASLSYPPPPLVHRDGPSYASSASFPPPPLVHRDDPFGFGIRRLSSNDAKTDIVDSQVKTSAPEQQASGPSRLPSTGTESLPVPQGFTPPTSIDSLKSLAPSSSNTPKGLAPSGSSDSVKGSEESAQQVSSSQDHVKTQASSEGASSQKSNGENPAEAKSIADRLGEKPGGKQLVVTVVERSSPRPRVSPVSSSSESVRSSSASSSDSSRGRGRSRKTTKRKKNKKAIPRKRRRSRSRSWSDSDTSVASRSSMSLVEDDSVIIEVDTVTVTVTFMVKVKVKVKIIIKITILVAQRAISAASTSSLPPVSQISSKQARAPLSSMKETTSNGSGSQQGSRASSPRRIEVQIRERSDAKDRVRDDRRWDDDDRRRADDRREKRGDREDRKDDRRNEYDDRRRADAYDRKWSNTRDERDERDERARRPDPWDDRRYDRDYRTARDDRRHVDDDRRHIDERDSRDDRKPTDSRRPYDDFRRSDDRDDRRRPDLARSDEPRRAEGREDRKRYDGWHEKKPDELPEKRDSHEEKRESRYGVASLKATEVQTSKTNNRRKDPMQKDVLPTNVVTSSNKQSSAPPGTTLPAPSVAQPQASERGAGASKAALEAGQPTALSSGTAPTTSSQVPSQNQPPKLVGRGRDPRLQRQQLQSVSIGSNPSTPDQSTISPISPSNPAVTHARAPPSAQITKELPTSTLSVAAKPPSQPPVVGVHVSKASLSVPPPVSSPSSLPPPSSGAGSSVTGQPSQEKAKGTPSGTLPASLKAEVLPKQGTRENTQGGSRPPSALSLSSQALISGTKETLPLSPPIVSKASASANQLPVQTKSEEVIAAALKVPAAKPVLATVPSSLPPSAPAVKSESPALPPAGLNMNPATASLPTPDYSTKTMEPHTNPVVAPPTVPVAKPVIPAAPTSAPPMVLGAKSESTASPSALPGKDPVAVAVSTLDVSSKMTDAAIATQPPARIDNKPVPGAGAPIPASKKTLAPRPELISSSSRTVTISPTGTVTVLASAAGAARINETRAPSKPFPVASSAVDSSGLSFRVPLPLGMQQNGHQDGQAIAQPVSHQAVELQVRNEAAPPTTSATSVQNASDGVISCLSEAVAPQPMRLVSFGLSSLSDAPGPAPSPAVPTAMESESVTDRDSDQQQHVRFADDALSAPRQVAMINLGPMEHAASPASSVSSISQADITTYAVSVGTANPTQSNFAALAQRTFQSGHVPIRNDSSSDSVQQESQFHIVLSTPELQSDTASSFSSSDISVRGSPADTNSFGVLSFARYES
ncbi:hypothetical protein HDU96_011120 [Phlyctochytrium bullatum]|nr:hypothetical protein HDU96_011120 [Phlyctochytrium bullatum]